MEQRQREITRQAVSNVRDFVSPFVGQKMSLPMWLRLLGFLFGIVSPAAKAVASVSREFYDSERAKAFPLAPRHDVYLTELSRERFMDDMKDFKSAFTGREIEQADVNKLVLRAARSVENCGRWTMMNAMQTPDPYVDSLIEKQEKQGKKKGTGVVRGWARVATGAETCGWCLMIVSRGAVYESAQTAGSKWDDRNTMQMVGAEEFKPDEHMNAWHDGCDCKVVPVFNLRRWEGKERFLAARRMWYSVTKGLSGKDSVRAFRRAAEAGEYESYLNKV